MTDFSVGDVVRVNDNLPYPYRPGETGVIARVYTPHARPLPSDYVAAVKFEDDLLINFCSDEIKLKS